MDKKLEYRNHQNWDQFKIMLKLILFEEDNLNKDKIFKTNNRCGVQAEITSLNVKVMVNALSIK